MTSKFGRIVPPFHRQENCNPSAAIRCLILGISPRLEGHLTRFSAIQTRLSCRVHLAVDFLGLRRSGSSLQRLVVACGVAGCGAGGRGSRLPGVEAIGGNTDEDRREGLGSWPRIGFRRAGAAIRTPIWPPCKRLNRLKVLFTTRLQHCPGPGSRSPRGAARRGAPASRALGRGRSPDNVMSATCSRHIHGNEAIQGIRFDRDAKAIRAPHASGCRGRAARAVAHPVAAPERRLRDGVFPDGARDRDRVPAHAALHRRSVRDDRSAQDPGGRCRGRDLGAVRRHRDDSERNPGHAVAGTGRKGHRAPQSSE